MKSLIDLIRHLLPALAVVTLLAGAPGCALFKAPQTAPVQDQQAILQELERFGHVADRTLDAIQAAVLVGKSFQEAGTLPTDAYREFLNVAGTATDTIDQALAEAQKLTAAPLNRRDVVRAQIELARKRIPSSAGKPAAYGYLIAALDAALLTLHIVS